MSDLHDMSWSELVLLAEKHRERIEELAYAIRCVRCEFEDNSWQARQLDKALAAVQEKGDD